MINASSFGRCRSCGASIRWLTTAAGKSIPVDPAGVDNDVTMFDRAKHKAHFVTCPNAAQHRGKR